MRSTFPLAREWWVLLLVLAAAACQNKPTDPTTTNGTSVPAAALVTIVDSGTLEQVTEGQTYTSQNYLAQSVTIPGSQAYNNLRFNWDGAVSASPTAPSVRGPQAVGTLFLLSQEYLGFPHNLGSSTPGFIGQSQKIEGGQYVFAPSVTVKGGAKYWFYSYWTPGSAPNLGLITGFSEDTYAAGEMYIAPELGGSIAPLPFRKAAASWRVISLGPPIEYYKPPAGTYVDANFKLMGAAGQ